MSPQANSKPRCIICKIILSNDCTKVNKNPRYLKYKGIVCNKCFDQYYPQINIDQD